MKFKLNIPNLLSLIRILTTPLFILAIFHLPKHLLAWIFLVIAITDFLDGYMARNLKQVTKFGKVLDPVADRIFMISSVIFLSLVFDTRLFIVLGRELTALPGFMIFLIKRKSVARISIIGKITTFLQSITVPAFLLGFDFAGLLMIITAIVGSFSGIKYTIKAIRI